MNRRNNFTVVAIASTVVIIATVVLTACSTTYKFGDLSERYCATASPETRNSIKEALTDIGVTVGVDFCAVRGLVDALIVTEDELK